MEIDFETLTTLARRSRVRENFDNLSHEEAIEMCKVMFDKSIELRDQLQELIDLVMKLPEVG